MPVVFFSNHLLLADHSEEEKVDILSCNSRISNVTPRHRLLYQDHPNLILDLYFLSR